MTIRTGTCAWCGEPFERAGGGRLGSYCSPAHRQAAHRARHAQGPPTATPELADALDRLRTAMTAPGQYAALDTWLSAGAVLTAAGDAWAGEPLPRPGRITEPPSRSTARGNRSCLRAARCRGP